MITTYPVEIYSYDGNPNGYHLISGPSVFIDLLSNMTCGVGDTKPILTIQSKYRSHVVAKINLSHGAYSETLLMIQRFVTSLLTIPGTTLISSSKYVLNNKLCSSYSIIYVEDTPGFTPSQVYKVPPTVLKKQQRNLEIIPQTLPKKEILSLNGLDENTLFEIQGINRLNSASNHYYHIKINGKYYQSNSSFENIVPKWKYEDIIFCDVTVELQSLSRRNKVLEFMLSD